MRILKVLIIFQQKLIIPTLLLSGLLGAIGIGITGDLSLKPLGISCIILGPLFHYFIYEIRTPNEYYFYSNLGLSREILWSVSFGFYLILGLIFIKS